MCKDLVRNKLSETYLDLVASQTVTGDADVQPPLPCSSPCSNDGSEGAVTGALGPDERESAALQVGALVKELLQMNESRESLKLQVSLLTDEVMKLRAMSGATTKSASLLTARDAPPCTNEIRRVQSQPRFTVGGGEKIFANTRERCGNPATEAEDTTSTLSAPSAQGLSAPSAPPLISSWRGRTGPPRVRVDRKDGGEAHTRDSAAGV